MTKSDQSATAPRLMQCEVCEQWKPEDAGASRRCEDDEWLWICNVCFEALKRASDEKQVNNLFTQEQF